MYRGYDAAVAARNIPNGLVVNLKKLEEAVDTAVTEEGTRGIGLTPEQEEKEVKEADAAKMRGRQKDRESKLPPVGNEGSEDVTDLILIIHGIGQGVRHP